MSALPARFFSFAVMHPSGCGRSGGRVVEGARLESEYTVKSRIEGSNPSRSAILTSAGRATIPRAIEIKRLAKTRASRDRGGMESATSTHGPRARIALLMISNFGVADGGRETWAYNFIPRLLERWPEVALDVIGLHRAGQQDNAAQVQALLRDRGSVTFLQSRRRRFPILSMLRQSPRSLSRARLAAPDLVIGVGSAIEALVIMLSP